MNPSNYYIITGGSQKPPKPKKKKPGNPTTWHDFPIDWNNHGKKYKPRRDYPIYNTAFHRN